MVSGDQLKNPEEVLMRVDVTMRSAVESYGQR